MVDSLRSVLISRDEMEPDEADAMIEEMREDVRNGANPEDLLYDIGLEPDYIFDIL